MSKLARASHRIYSLLPTEIEGIDSLASTRGALNDSGLLADAFLKELWPSPSNMVCGCRCGAAAGTWGPVAHVVSPHRHRPARRYWLARPF